LAACVAAMNAKARQLGMNDTHFVEPTGLSCDNVASAGDLAKLVIAASHVEAIRGYSTDESHELRVHNRMLEFHNTDLLVQNPAWHIVVQKTGYISEAGRCLVLKAIIHGRSVVIVLLDSLGKYTRVADAERIRRWLEARVVTHGTWGPA
jgi:D-alanyl-D-alanine endopeptidase (penicillin-binding protein 7)